MGRGTLNHEAAEQFKSILPQVFIKEPLIDKLLISLHTIEDINVLSTIQHAHTDRIQEILHMLEVLITPNLLTGNGLAHSFDAF